MLQKSIDTVTPPTGVDPSAIATNGAFNAHVSAPAAVLELITGRWASQIVGLAAELGLADQIQTGPKTAEEIAAVKGLHAPSLHRLLRALTSVSIFVEQEDGRFAQTPMSDALRSDVPYSLRGFARFDSRPYSLRSWVEIGYSIQTGTAASEKAFGTQAFEYFNQHPEERDIFVEAMRGFTAESGPALVEAYDFSGLHRLADIGGSQGSLLSLVLPKYPKMRGVLFDLPNVVEGAAKFLESCQLGQRVEIKGGNFFETIPSGADAYLFKHILHDWGDDDCVRILQNVHTAARSGSTLLIVEAVLEASRRSRLASLLDIQMLAMAHGGKERSLSEWQQLLQRTGFRFSRVVPTSAFTSVIEAFRE